MSFKEEGQGAIPSQACIFSQRLGNALNLASKTAPEASFLGTGKRGAAHVTVLPDMFPLLDRTRVGKVVVTLIARLRSEPAIICSNTFEGGRCPLLFGGLTGSGCGGIAKEIRKTFTPPRSLIL